MKEIHKTKNPHNDHTKLAHEGIQQLLFNNEIVPGQKISYRMIAEKLDEIGVHYIEGGWPNPTNLKDMEFYKRVKELRLSMCRDCPSWKNYRCTECGCQMRVKAGLSSSECPLKKWGRHLQ